MKENNLLKQMMNQGVHRLLKVSRFGFAAIFILTAVLVSVVIVLSIDLLWDGRLSLELEFAGVVTPFLDSLLLVILFIAMLDVIRAEIELRKKAEESANRLSRRNESILNAAGEGIMGLDTEGLQTFVNPAATRMLGYSEDELIGNRSHEVWHHTKPDGSPYPARECPIYATFKDGAVHHETENVFWRKDGISFPVEYKSTPIIEQGNVVGAVVAFSDITGMVKLREQLEKLSITDALTGLYNRRGFLAFAAPHMKLSQRKMENICMIYADMDNLKTINDNFGHQEGDKALAEIATILKSTFRESDVLARLGGDEFAILAINTCEVKVLQERIQENIGSYNREVNPVHKLSLSVGIICYDPQEPCTLDELLNKADALMYENKMIKKRSTEVKT